MKMIRQGDVLLVAVNKMPPRNVTPKAEVILAEGELTGHAHRLTAAAVYEWQENGQRYTRVAGDLPGEISHEDHDPEPVAVIEPETTYRVIPQQELDIKGQWRKVQD